MSVIDCPNCGSSYTKLEHRVTQWDEEMRHIRTCNDCPTEFEVVYVDPLVENVTTL